MIFESPGVQIPMFDWKLYFSPFLLIGYSHDSFILSFFFGISGKVELNKTRSLISHNRGKAAMQATTYDTKHDKKKRKNLSIIWGARWWYSSKIQYSVRQTHMRRFKFISRDLSEHTMYAHARDLGLVGAGGGLWLRQCWWCCLFVSLPLSHSWKRKMTYFLKSIILKVKPVCGRNQ